MEKISHKVYYRLVPFVRIFLDTFVHYTLQFHGDNHIGQDRSQVPGHGLLTGDEYATLLLYLVKIPVNKNIIRYDIFSALQIVITQALHGREDGFVNQITHPHDKGDNMIFFSVQDPVCHITNPRLYGRQNA